MRNLCSTIMYEPFQLFGQSDSLKKMEKLDTLFESSVLLLVSDKVADFQVERLERGWR